MGRGGVPSHKKGDSGAGRRDIKCKRCISDHTGNQDLNPGLPSSISPVLSIIPGSLPSY